jgi:hypothetical protein
MSNNANGDAIYLSRLDVIAILEMLNEVVLRSETRPVFKSILVEREF